MRAILAAALLLGIANPAPAQVEPCRPSALDSVKGAGFLFAATCERHGDELVVTVVARRGGATEAPAGVAPKYLKRLKLSFAGVLVRADAPPGYDVVTEPGEPPTPLAVIWLRRPDTDDRVERSEASFVVRLRGADAAITCPHEYATDTIAGGVTCGIPPSPPNTRVEPAATTIVVGFQHPAAAAHARRR